MFDELVRGVGGQHEHSASGRRLRWTGGGLVLCGAGGGGRGG